MATRILHCGKSIENYNLCITEKVCGFTKRVADEGDRIYIVVRVGQETLCGARAVLSSVTDYKPWADADRYVQCFMLSNMEFCNPFDISILGQVGGQHWSVKFVQSSKEIKVPEAVALLKSMMDPNVKTLFFKIQSDTLLDQGTLAVSRGRGALVAAALAVEAKRRVLTHVLGLKYPTVELMWFLASIRRSGCPVNST